MYMSVAEVAKKVGCSPRNINYHIEKGNIMAFKFPNGRNMIHENLIPAIRHIVKSGQGKK